MMGLASFLTQLESQPFAVAIAESPWLFPTLESVHVLALTLVVGSIAMVDLRLLGVGRARAHPVTQLAEHLLPFTWSAFVIAFATGALMFSSKATTYAANVPFQVKLLLLAAAGLNMLLFHAFAYRQVEQWDEAPKTPLAAKIAAAVSLSLWVSVVVFGRWIGFV